MKAWGDLPAPRRKETPVRRVVHHTRWVGVDSPIDPGPYPASAIELLERPVEVARRGRRRVARGDPGRDAIEAATAAMLGLGESIGKRELTDPVIASAYRFARKRVDWVNVPQLLAAYARAADRAGRDGDFPWSFDPGGGSGSHLYAAPHGAPVHWRPRDRPRLVADRVAYARWFVEPIAQVEVLELLAELAERNDTQGEAAVPIRAGLLPLIEAGFALHVGADDPWRDLFALWLLTRAPATLGDLWYLAVAVAYRYGSISRRFAGPVIGTGAFEGEQLVSASAALGSVLWQLRIYPSLVPELLAFVSDSAAADGGWADPGQSSDVMTTLMAADLLLSLDPTFDPQPTIAWFARTQEDDGWWRALGPEVPWLTSAVVDWLIRATGPAVDRFRWPGALKIDLDRRTRLPTFAWFADLVRSIAEMPGLAGADWEIAFIDLAGFGQFNTTYGQAKGDDVIGAFGRALARIPGSRAIRDGGDEFIVIGSPGASGLYDRLDLFRGAWLREFQAIFGETVRPVRPRITVSRTTGEELAAARERLGRRIGELKKASPDPPDDGVIERS